MTLLDYALASWNSLEDTLSSSKSLLQVEMVGSMRAIRNEISLICAGLLGIHEKGAVASPESLFRLGGESAILAFRGEATEDDILHFESRKVSFARRTAFDFLKSCEQGKAFLNHNTPADFEPQVSYVKI